MEGPFCMFQNHCWERFIKQTIKKKLLNFFGQIQDMYTSSQITVNTWSTWWKHSRFISSPIRVYMISSLNNFLWIKSIFKVNTDVVVILLNLSSRNNYVNFHFYKYIIISDLYSAPTQRVCSPFQVHFTITAAKANHCSVSYQYEREPPSPRSTPWGAYRSASHFVQYT